MSRAFNAQAWREAQDESPKLVTALEFEEPPQRGQRVFQYQQYGADDRRLIVSSPPHLGIGLTTPISRGKELASEYLTLPPHTLGQASSQQVDDLIKYLDDIRREWHIDADGGRRIA